MADATVTVDTEEPGRLDLTIPRGRDVAVDFAFEDDDGNTVDVSNDTFAADVRRDPTDPTVAFSWSVQNSTFGASNEIQLTLTPADTASEDPAPHAWDLRQTTAAGEEFSIVRGTLHLTAEVTD